MKEGKEGRKLGREGGTDGRTARGGKERETGTYNARTEYGKGDGAPVELEAAMYVYIHIKQLLHNAIFFYMSNTPGRNSYVYICMKSPCIHATQTHTYYAHTHAHTHIYIIYTFIYIYIYIYI